MTYDPDDQFFQAFRSGWLSAASAHQYPTPDEHTIWRLYVDWLHS